MGASLELPDADVAAVGGCVVAGAARGEPEARVRVHRPHERRHALEVGAAARAGAVVHVVIAGVGPGGAASDTGEDVVADDRAAADRVAGLVAQVDVAARDVEVARAGLPRVVADGGPEIREQGDAVADAVPAAGP